jgi:hypothetical protein
VLEEAIRRVIDVAAEPGLQWVTDITIAALSTAIRVSLFQWSTHDFHAMVVCYIDRARTKNQARSIDQSVQQSTVTLEISSDQQCGLTNGSRCGRWQ